jgi:hypothetical protein
VVDGLNERFEQLEAEIFRHRADRETLEDLYELKRKLLLLRSATSPLLDICNGLMRFHPHIIPKDVQPYFRDISDHVKRINQAIDSMREMLTAAMQVHLSLVTVRQNEVVKRLAGWGGDSGDTHHGLQFVRHEFQIHAGIGVAVWVSLRDGRRGYRLHRALSQAEAGGLVVNQEKAGQMEPRRRFFGCVESKSYQEERLKSHVI